MATNDDNEEMREYRKMFLGLIYLGLLLFGGVSLMSLLIYI